MKKNEFKQRFIQEILNFIEKTENYELQQSKNSLNCGNCFQNSDQYQEEKRLLYRIQENDFQNTKQQGDELENLIKSLFQKISLVHSVEITNKDTSLGQIDIQLIPIGDDNMLYTIWGIRDHIPRTIIGECKNYPNKPVGRPEIEKICWRTCKGGCLSFFIGFEFTQPALDEIGDFNRYKDSICLNCEGSLIVPITILMLETIIENDINFCYFILWAIKASKMMSITNYIQKVSKD